MASCPSCFPVPPQSSILVDFSWDTQNLHIYICMCLHYYYCITTVIKDNMTLLITLPKRQISFSDQVSEQLCGHLKRRIVDFEPTMSFYFFSLQYSPCRVRENLQGSSATMQSCQKLILEKHFQQPLRQGSDTGTLTARHRVQDSRHADLTNATGLNIPQATQRSCKSSASQLTSDLHI